MTAKIEPDPICTVIKTARAVIATKPKGHSAVHAKPKGRSAAAAKSKGFSVIHTKPKGHSADAE